jgi:hypothetical protein
LPFSPSERQALLALKGVGPKVIERLEQMELDSLAKLARADVDAVLRRGAALTGSNCWKNSPQARAAIEAAVKVAKR